MSVILSNHIAGRWRYAEADETMPLINPATEEVVAYLPRTTAEDIAEAIDASVAAFVAWKRTVPASRSALLREVARLMRERIEQLAAPITRETGKPITQARAEIESSARYLEWFAEESRRLNGELLRQRGPGEFALVSYEPVGPVGVLTAWNFPISLLCRKLGPALAAGCPVLMRPANEGAGSVVELMRCFVDADAPDGLVQLLLGDGETISAAFMADARVRKISFTGSVPVGKALIRASADTVKRLSMELGGHAPFIVFEDVDAARMGTLAAKRKFANAGQICVSPGRFFVQRKSFDTFVDAFVEAAADLVVGDPMAQATEMGPLANARRFEAIGALVDEAREQGVLRHGGTRPDGLDNRGYFMSPAVVIGVGDDHRLMREEIFGPVAPIVSFDSEDEVVARANDVEVGLAGFVFTESLGRAHRVADSLECGIVGVNALAIGMPEAPFGGVKASGYGREGSWMGMLDYVQPKLTLVKHEIGQSMKDEEKKLRSQTWFGVKRGRGMGARIWMKNQGLPHDMFEGKPVIGICNTWSELNPCNGHLRELARHVREGVLEAGGFPVEFPVMGLGENQMRPTTMLYRNLLAMEAEESIRANPLDGVVLLCGCDKTTPGLLMAAASVDLPSIVVSGGPMLNGWSGRTRLGNGTSFFKLHSEFAAGTASDEAYANLEFDTARSAGSCNTMGTASTMASMCEALGIALPQNGATPAVDARRLLARMAGRRAVELVREDIKPSDILTRKAFENAILTNGAIGGSTNAVVHLKAVAGRVGVPLDLDDWDRLGRDMPCLLNLMPSGDFLMEDFYYAGGLPAVMALIRERLYTDVPVIEGGTLGERLDGAKTLIPEVIRPLDDPFKPQGGIAVLKGNLAPDGAVLKPSAASPELMKHRGRAVVFKNLIDFRSRVNDPDLDIDPSCVMVLQNAGPKGNPGMPEVGNMELPEKVLRQGVRDMVRISDARMSGTAFGTVVLHVAPEAAVGGPLALVRDGDMIELDVAARTLHLDVPDEELARRRAAWREPGNQFESGWEKLYVDTVEQADRGADLSFLKGRRGSEPRYR